MRMELLLNCFILKWLIVLHKLSMSKRLFLILMLVLLLGMNTKLRLFSLNVSTINTG